MAGLNDYNRPDEMAGVKKTSEEYQVRRDPRVELSKWVSSIAPEIKVVGDYVCQKSGYSIQMEKTFYESINGILTEAIYAIGKEHLYPYCLGLLLSRITPTYEKALCYFCKKEVREKEWYKQPNETYSLIAIPAVCHKKCYKYVLSEQKARKFVNESAKEIPECSEKGDIVEKLRKVTK